MKNNYYVNYFNIEFYFNFKKGAKSLSLEDLEKGSDTLDSLPPNKEDSLWAVFFVFMRKREKVDSNHTRRSRTQSGQRACEREGQSPSNPPAPTKNRQAFACRFFICVRRTQHLFATLVANFISNLFELHSACGHKMKLLTAN